MSWLSNAVNKVKSVFKSEKKAIAAYFAPIMKSLESNIGLIIMDVATAAVLAAAGSPVAGATKLATVLMAIKGVLTANALPYAEHVVRGAVEAAVAALPDKANRVVQGVGEYKLPDSSTELTRSVVKAVQDGIKDAKV